MRHGWEWWEAFDRYLQDILKKKGEFYRLSWYKARKKEFWELWKKEHKKFIDPPKPRSE